MDGACQTFRLSPTPGAEGCAALQSFLTGARGAPVHIEAGNLRRLGALTAQLLLAARLAWEAEGQPLTFSDPEGSLSEGLARLGLSATFGEDGA